MAPVQKPVQDLPSRDLLMVRNLAAPKWHKLNWKLSLRAAQSTYTLSFNKSPNSVSQVMPLPVYPLEMLQDISETTATLYRIDMNLPPSCTIQCIKYCSISEKKYSWTRCISQKPNCTRSPLLRKQDTNFAPSAFFSKEASSHGHSSLLKHIMQRQEEKGTEHFEFSMKQSAQENQKEERRKQANKKWKTNSLYKTLFKPQMQVTFVILNPFFILLERPQLIKAEREFIQTCVT